MKIKPIIALCLMTGIGTAVSAEQPVLVFQKSGSADPAKVALTTDTRIVFSDDAKQLNVSDPAQPQDATFDLADVEKITFDLSSSSVDDITAQLGALTITNHFGTVTLEADGAINYGAWTAAGQQVMSGTANGNVELDFKSLPAGVYILKANDKTIKFINK